LTQRRCRVEDQVERGMKGRGLLSASPDCYGGRGWVLSSHLVNGDSWGTLLWDQVGG